MSDEQPAQSSPLEEAAKWGLNDLFDRINEKLILGLPETITDDDLMPVVLNLRDRRGKYTAEMDAKAAAGPRTRRKAAPKTIAEALDVDLDALDAL